MKKKIIQEIEEFKILLKSIPSLTLILLVLASFSMNLLANKSIALPFNFLALDCGIIVSWFLFLTMDIITVRFGPKAATQITVFSVLINILMCLVFFVASLIPGFWGESYAVQDGTQINIALNNTFGGTWYIIVGSMAALIIGSATNNFSNYFIGKIFVKNPDGAFAYFSRSYISTAVGQFMDNLSFALIVSHVFFGWTLVQCFFCAVTGMVAELLCEIIFSVFGYKTLNRWKKENVGHEYLSYIKNKKEQAT